MRESENNLPPASILGVGAVTPLGRNLPDIAQRLTEPPSPPATTLCVNDQWLQNPAIGGRMRRADRFVRMAASAALDAWTDAALTNTGISMERVGLILASGLGPHVRGFRFLDGILDCGDSAALPTDFSHSVHCAASAYITELLGLRGPALSITDFENGVEQALLMAQCWLAENRCERVLVGAVEELGEVMVYCASRLLPDARFIPGEGAVFLMLGSNDAGGMARLNVTAQPHDIDLLMLDDPPIPAYASHRPAIKARHTSSFNPYFGHSASSAVFQLLGGLLALRTRQPLGKKIDGPSDSDHSASSIDSAATFMPSSTSDARMLLLTRNNG